MGNLNRTIIDTQVGYSSVALPAANASLNSGIIDLQQAPSLLQGNGTAVVEDVQFGISLPALPNLANGQTVTGTLQDSADGVTFANVAAVPVLTSTGAGGVGAAANPYTGRFPLTIRRYLQVVWAASATAGNNTGSNGQFNLFF